MQRYIEQLIKDFNNAKQNAVSKGDFPKPENDFLEMMEKLEDNERISEKLTVLLPIIVFL